MQRWGTAMVAAPFACRGDPASWAPWGNTGQIEDTGEVGTSILPFFFLFLFFSTRHSGSSWRVHFLTGEIFPQCLLLVSRVELRRLSTLTQIPITHCSLFPWLSSLFFFFFAFLTFSPSFPTVTSLRRAPYTFCEQPMNYSVQCTQRTKCPAGRLFRKGNTGKPGFKLTQVMLSRVSWM